MNICIFFKEAPETDRFFRGDRYIRPFIRNLVRKKKTGGVEKVFLNLCAGLKNLNISVLINPSFKKIAKEDAVIVLGTGRHILKGYDKENKIIAGIGMMTYPLQWPELCEEYPVARYLQHCEWASNIYKPYFGEAKCILWPAGIDTKKWESKKDEYKPTILVYNKIRWDYDKHNEDLRLPILKLLEEKGHTIKEIVYGNYTEDEYFTLLSESHSMIFLCEHESQGFACCEAMSMDVPVFAWDQGFCLDPKRHIWGLDTIPATSVPFFDDRCGMRFTDFDDFWITLDKFISRVELKDFAPREYVEENLTLEKSAVKMLEIIKEVYQ